MRADQTAARQAEDAPSQPMDTPTPLVRNPAFLLGAAVAAVVLAALVWSAFGIHTGSDEVGREHAPPRAIAAWIYEQGGFAAGVLLVLAAARSIVRHRRLQFWVLWLLAGTTMFWQEFYADWGIHLEFPDNTFARMPWGATVFTQEIKPWCVVPLYAWFFVVFPLIMVMIDRIRTARPTWNRTAILLVTAAVVFYGWDALFEGFVATPLGWFSYSESLGPSVNWERGMFPLLYPLLPFTLFGVLVCWIFDRRDYHGRLRLEVASNVYRVAEGWRREAARLGVWVITLNACYLLVCITPWVLLRAL